jgi:hypothetical protein
MLGDKIGEETGKVTSRRVLPGDDYRYVKLEISFESQATVLGVPCQNIGTYTIFERIPGQIYGEGQGILLAQDGSGAIWKGHGVGTARDGGTMAFAAAVAMQTNSPAWMALNSMMVVAEHTIDMEGNAHTGLWAWTA